MINDQKLQQDIMARVKTIYGFKLLLRPAMEIIVLLGLTLAAKSLVFWQSALANLARLSADHWVGYTTASFLHTNILVELVLLGLVVGGFYFVVTINQTYQAVTKLKFRVL